MPDEGPRIAVDPTDHHWYDAIVEAVERGGGRLVDVADAEGLVWTAKDEADLRSVLHDGIRWVQIPHAGVEKWVLNGELDDQRVFTSVRGVYVETVGEHVIAMIFAGARRLHVCARLHEWDEPRGEGRLLRGSTVAIVGAGGIGREVIRYLEPFGVRIITVTRDGREVPGADVNLPVSRIDEVWPQADYPVIIAPATEETRGMVDRAAFEAMPDHAFLVNVARGMLVDTDDLVDALREGLIDGAAIDVTDPEPLPTGHPLWSLPNVLITPHVANPNVENVRKLQERISANVRRFGAGEELLGIIDLELGY